MKRREKAEQLATKIRTDAMLRVGSTVDTIEAALKQAELEGAKKALTLVYERGKDLRGSRDAFSLLWRFVACTSYSSVVEED